MTTPQTLLSSLDSDDAMLRQRAAMALGATQVGEGLPELVARTAAEPDDFVRETLIWAVVAQDDPVPTIVQALYDPSLPREPLLHTLSKIGDPAAVAAIVPFADDADPVVAAKAWWALGRMGAELPLLTAHLGATDAVTRQALTRALLQAGEPAVTELQRVLAGGEGAARTHAAEVLVALADPDLGGTRGRRDGSPTADAAVEALRTSPALEVDGALRLASMDDDRPALAEVARGILAER